MHHNTAILIFSKPGQIDRRNQEEPYAALPWEDIDALFTAFLGDVIQNACQLPHVDVLLYRNSRELSDDFLAPFRQRVRCIETQEDSLSQEIYRAVDQAFLDHHNRVLVVIDNHPIYSPLLFKRMLDQLGGEDDCVVINPTIQGKCSIIGLKTNHCWLFDTADGDPLAKPQLLMERICRLNTLVLPAKTSYFLDSGTQLAKLKQDLEEFHDRSEDFPRRTYEIFKMLDKKYKLKKPAR